MCLRKDIKGTWKRQSCLDKGFLYHQKDQVKEVKEEKNISNNYEHQQIIDLGKCSKLSYRNYKI